jgi:hypothetical protein
MKVCPNCSFTNDERFPTCAVCNATIVDVPSTVSPDPDHPEHERRALAGERHKSTRKQLQSAAVLYAVLVTLSAALPGLVWSPPVLLLYFASGVIVAIAVTRNMVGPFGASFLQGLLSVILMIYFGPTQPLIFFMLVGHITIPAFFCHWTDLIHDANR